jgi:hypothetical protein
MIALLLAAATAVQPPASGSVQAALQLCRPKLAERVSGDISSISVDASLAANGWTVIRGPLRALIGMGEPSPEHASTHHLIRADYDFICWVHDNRVRKLEVNRKY